MGTLGFQILLESARQLIAKVCPQLHCAYYFIFVPILIFLKYTSGTWFQTRPDVNRDNEKWVIGIMVSVTIIKFLLMVYCRRFKNEIVRAYAQDHFFDVVTNSVGLASTVLAVRYEWWIDPLGAIVVSTRTNTSTCL